MQHHISSLGIKAFTNRNELLHITQLSNFVKIPVIPGASYLFPGLYLVSNLPVITAEWEGSGARHAGCAPYSTNPELTVITWWHLYSWQFYFSKHQTHWKFHFTFYSGKKAKAEWNGCCLEHWGHIWEHVCGPLHCEIKQFSGKWKWCFSKGKNLNIYTNQIQ